MELRFKGYIGAFLGSALGLPETGSIRRPSDAGISSLANAKQALCSEMLR